MKPVTTIAFPYHTYPPKPKPKPEPTWGTIFFDRSGLPKYYFVKEGIYAYELSDKKDG